MRIAIAEIYPKVKASAHWLFFIAAPCLSILRQGAAYIDIDDFKKYNSTYTEPRVDRGSSLIGSTGTGLDGGLGSPGNTLRS